MDPIFNNNGYNPFFQSGHKMRDYQRRKPKIHFTELKPLDMNKHLKPHLRVTKWNKNLKKGSDLDKYENNKNEDFMDTLKKKRKKFLKRSIHLGVEGEKKLEDFVQIRNALTVFFLIFLVK